MTFSRTNIRFCLLLIATSTAQVQPAVAQQSTENNQSAARPEAPGDVQPLASKEEMIRDRFQRFEDKVFRLRDLLQVGEPDNATRLERVLQRAGELGISDRLEEMVELLRDPSALTTAFDAQNQWLSDVDRLLAILMERDSDNAERQAEIDRLERYNTKVGEILEQQRALRDASAQDAAEKRLSQQLGDAIKRVDALLERQKGVSGETKSMGEDASPGDQKSGGTGQQSSEGSGEKTDAEMLAESQEALSRDTKQLAEDLKQLGAQPADDNAQDPAKAEAQSGARSAAASAQQAAGAMSKASESLQQSQASAAQGKQQEAESALQEAKEALEEAKRQLDEATQPDSKAEEQEKLAEETEALSQQMQQESSSGGGNQGQQGQQGQEGQQGKQGQPSQSQSGPPPPGQQNLDQAQSEMEDAAESLGESEPGKAKPSQDRAVEQLEQAKKELEEALNQLRKEEREETLRDLESRFREMLSKQRAINEATVRLDQIGRSKFGRPERLELAELSAKERVLSQDAATCLHILDEDGTTVAFPRVVEQLSEDMDTVADRLADLRVGALTQTIEKEIVDTLEQLLEAVHRMQQENEQQGMPGAQQPGQEQAALLPPSAELKLLRASQVRVNERTDVIESARVAASDPTDDLSKALQKVAKRQKECAEIAVEMRDQQQRP